MGTKNHMQQLASLIHRYNKSRAAVGSSRIHWYNKTKAAAAGSAVCTGTLPCVNEMHNTGEQRCLVFFHRGSHTEKYTKG